MLQVLREHAIDMLTAGMYTRAVAHKPSPKAFQKIWQYIQLASQPQTMCNHTSPGPPHPASSPPRSSETAAATIGLDNKKNSAQTVRNRLICMLVILIGVSTWLQFVIVTGLSGQMLTFDGIWHFVLFTDESRFSLYRADGRQRIWRHVGEQFTDVNVMDRVAHGGGGVMVWAGLCYGQRTQVHFIESILNAQRYHDEILSPIVVPFIHNHHLILQHDNARPPDIARPHVARICTQFLEAENIPVLAWPA